MLLFLPFLLELFLWGRGWSRRKICTDIYILTQRFSSLFLTYPNISLLNIVISGGSMWISSICDVVCVTRVYFLSFLLTAIERERLPKPMNHTFCSSSVQSIQQLLLAAWWRTPDTSTYSFCLFVSFFFLIVAFKMCFLEVSGVWGTPHHTGCAQL